MGGTCGWTITSIAQRAARRPLRGAGLDAGGSVATGDAVQYDLRVV